MRNGMRIFVWVCLFFNSACVFSLTCPSSVSFYCVPVGGKYCQNKTDISVCTWQNPEQVWHFAASRRSVRPSSTSSCSSLPTGSYRANYGFSYYGSFDDIDSQFNAAACFYYLNDGAFVGLYTPHYIYDSKQAEWRKMGNRYACEGAESCRFVPL